MNRLMHRAVAVILAAVLLFPISAQALSAEKAIVMDAATGRVLYAKRPDERSLIASTTKIMTALIVSEQCNVLDRMRIPKEAVGIEGSSMYLQEGEILTVQDLLYGLMLRSGNDAAVALAIYCGGTVEGFVSMMNDKARRLNLSGTHFANPNGLDHPDHYSTARDLADLTAYAMKNPVFAQTVGTKNVKSGERILQNHNKLLWSVPGADGVKTGYTKAAGRILVSSVCREGRRLITVTINDPNDWKDHAALTNDGFNAFKIRRIIEKGQTIGQISVFGGAESSVNVLAGSAFSYALTNDEIPQVIMAQPDFSYAPISQGQHAGTAYICLGNTVIGQIPLSYEKTVEQMEYPPHHFWNSWFGGKKK